jgi:2,4-dienoyl-CoA reductase-like NADH-dependent reductase (Old Yellow Enzyme family)
MTLAAAPVRSLKAFEPCRVGPLAMRNRIAMAPMSQHAATAAGEATDWHAIHYGSRAVGGCGLVLVEDTAVAPSGRLSAGALGAYDDGHVAGLRRIAEFCRGQGAAVGIQLAHSGPKARGGAHLPGGLISASARPYRVGRPIPRAAGRGELRDVVAAFAGAAQRVLDAGFDMVEIHATYGSLLHQFLSPLANARSDELGGTPERRARMLLEVVGAVAAVWPDDRLLAVRLPAVDGDPGGLSSEEIAAVAGACAAQGVRLVTVAGGLPGCDAIPGAHEHAATARAVAEHAGVAACVGGGIRRAADAERLMAASGAELVAVGRPLLIDPYWTLREAAEQLSTELAPPAFERRAA